MAESLKATTIKGVGWSAIDNVSQYAVSFLVSIVLARLLSPDDYGLLGIIAIFTAICTALINGGFTNALIRKKEVTENDYNTVFIINLVMSVLMYIIIFICAPYIALFFGRDELVLLTRVSSLGMIFGALSLVQQTILTKQIDFKTQTKVSIISSVVSGILGITMAMLGFGVWSLVAQQLSSQVVRTMLLWFYNHWLPNCHFSVPSFKELFGFGWKILVSGLLDTVWKEMYQVVVGKYYSPATLGQYTRANQFSQLFSTNLTGVIQRVTFPVLSNIQDDKQRMIGAYKRIIKVTMFITAICMLSLAAVSEPLLYCLIGPKWHEAATYLPLICITGSLYPLHAINLNMLQIQGRSDLFLVLEILKKIILIAPIIVGILWGVMPMLFVNLIVGVVGYFLNSHWSGQFLGYSSWMQLRDVAPSYGIAVFIAIFIWPLKFLPVSNWIILPIQVILGVLFFVGACKTTKIEEYEYAKQLISPLFQKLKKH